MKTKVTKRYGSYVVQFTQGVQTFHIPNLEKTKEHAIWQKEMLDKAFENFKTELLQRFSMGQKNIKGKKDGSYDHYTEW